MENNRVSTIFSALRQNLTSRMLNSGIMVEIDTRLEIIKRFIQLISNSGHCFSFIRSVIQQGLSKYNYMLERDQMDVENKKY